MERTGMRTGRLAVSLWLLGFFVWKGTSTCKSTGSLECPEINVTTTLSDVTITGMSGNFSVNVTYINNTVVPVSVEDHTITNLLPDTQYVLVFWDSNVICCKNVTTTPSKPGPLKLVEVETNSMTLNWTEPENMSRGEYSFNITYEPPSGPSLHLNNTGTSVNLTGLTAGTNYTVMVVTIGALGYHSLPESKSFYTKPEKIPTGNITVIAPNISTNSLQVSWTKPSGNVEYYVIDLQGAVNFTQNSTSVTFTNLLPDRNYSITITTVSGDHRQRSDLVFCATYPSKPGTLNLVEVGTNNMFLNWSEPENMSRGEYYFNITYKPSSGYSLHRNDTSVNLTGLTAGTKFTVTVVTIGAFGYQSLPESKSFYTKPEKIPTSNITVIAPNISTNSLQVSWTKPSGNVEYYVIDLQGAVNFTQNSTSVTFTNLLPDRNYSITITTVSGDHRQRSDLVFCATYPSKPGTLNLVEVGTNNMFLNWSEPENMSRGEYYFNITYKPSSGYSLHRNDTSVNLTGLTAGTKFTVTVVTIGAFGYQSLPESKSFYTKPEKIPTSNITVIAPNISTNSLQVSWTKPSGNVEYYVIDLQGAVNFTQNSTSVTFTNLLPDRNYSITITTVSGDHRQRSDLVFCATYPSKPGTLNLVEVGTNSMLLNWSEPENMSRGEYYFNITYKPSSGYSLHRNDTSVNLTGLTAGTKFTVTVVTIGAFGYQSLPESKSFYTKPEKIPTGNITVIAPNISTNSLQVSWTKPPGNVEYYVIDLQGAVNFTQNSTSVKFTNLLPDRNYSITITTVSGDHRQRSDLVFCATYPSKPGTLNLIEVGTNNMFLNWNEPENMSRGEYYFNITYKPSSGYSLHRNDTSVNLTGLTAGTKYTVTVVTIGTLGYQSLPESKSFYTKPEKIPTGNITVIAPNISTNSLQVSWTKPPGNVEYYVIDLQGAVNFTQNSTSVTFTNLLPDRNYSITITTVSGDHRQRSDLVFCATYPSKPGTLNLVEVGTNNMFLNWSEPENMSRGEYYFNITYKPSSGYSLHRNDTSVNLTGLTAGTKFTVTVVTIGAFGYQSLLESKSFYTKPEKIPTGNITVIAPNISTNSLQVSWTKPPGNVEYYVIDLQGAVNFTQNSTSPKDRNFRALTEAGGTFIDSISQIGPGVPPCQSDFRMSAMNLDGGSLTAGTKFTVTVVTIGALDIRVYFESKSFYTKPEKIPTGNITVIAPNISTNSLQVSWTKPPGNVEYYVIDLQGAVNFTQNSTSVTFTNLLPDRNYSITITTVSGDHRQRSDLVFCATYPSKPGTLNLVEVGTNNMFLNWSEPENMSRGEYYFNITYKPSSGYSLHRNDTSVNLTGLTAGTKFTVTVVTIGAFGYQSLLESKSFYTKPEKIPTGNITVIAPNISTNSLQVSWTKPPGNVEYYVIDLQGAVNFTQNSTSVTFTNLLPDRNYSITITTVSGDHRQRSDLVFCATYPSKPGTLNLVEVGTNNMFLNWSEPENMSRGEYYFNITYKPSSGYSLHRNDTSVNLTGLTAGTKFTVTVVTIGAFGYQSLLESKSFYTKPEKIPTGNITVIARNISTNSLQVSWTKPPGNVEYYVIDLQGAVNFTQNSTSVTFTNLLPDRNYSITITTVSGDHRQRSDLVFCATYPSKPGTLNLIEVGTNNMFLNWNEPENMSRGEYYFNITYKPSSGYSLHRNDTSVNLTGLTAGTKYTVTVVTIGTLGFQSLPKSKSFYTKPEKIPTGNITVIAPNISTNSLQVSWTKPPGNVEYYVIDLQGAVNFTQNSTSVTFTNLLPDRNYSITITTVSGDHRQRSDLVFCATYPSKPGTLNLVEVGTNNMFLNWSEPENMSRGEYYFNITYKPSSGYSLHRNDTSVNLTGLTAGTKHTVTVVTIGALGYQSLPESKSFYTKPEKIPTGNITVIAPNISTNSLQVSWTKPPGNVEYYVIDLQGAVNFTQNSTSVTFTNLLPDRNYSITITTVSGDHRQRSDLVFCATYPSKPGTLNLIEVGTNNMFLNWNEPENMSRGEYYFNITYKPSSGYSLHRNDTSVNLTGLTAGTKYTVTVVTIGALGYQSLPESNSFYTKPKKPRNLQLFKVTNNSVVLKWDQPDEYSSTYTYRVEKNGDASSNTTSKNEMVTVEQLTPGQNYSFSVFTRAEDGTEGANAFQSVCTDADSVSDLSCFIETGKPALTVWWKCPLGINRGFKILIKSNEWRNETEASACTSNNQTLPLVNLKYSTSYTINVTTLSCGKGSLSVQRANCWTPDSMGAIAGATVVSLLGAAVVLIAAGLLIRRKRREQRKNDMFSFTPVKTAKSKLVQVAEFESHFKKQNVNTCYGFCEEYESLKPVGITQLKYAADIPENKGKNRYIDILPYDISRVKLPVGSQETDDYINANYIPGYNSKKEFIAAQGPLPNTVPDFWRMVWEKNVFVIVMLTKCIEQGKSKCNEYWPTKESRMYGNIFVAITSEIILPDWTIRDFSVKNRRVNDTRPVRQFHFTAWPDHGVPETSDILINFRCLVREHIKHCPSNSPILVHCSAGVGRTGTFIAIDHMIYQIELENSVDVLGIVHDLRMHRALMVQTESQYIFLNQCALDIIKARSEPKSTLVYENTDAMGIYEDAIPNLTAANGYSL
uniref:Receptor-type tyrosine-protein phosphatase eta n=1 Tax=Geotrypetes seraphini TaxID=260995 RepID=A0A6P8PRY3_GEOSA|nr:receptor-type tyrosine-protein phosphatase beta-like [Geotrypetes seraphini]